MKNSKATGRALSVAVLLVVSAAVFPVAADSTSDPRLFVEKVLDDWHEAASKADEARYFGHFAPDGVFLGTDGSERWNLAAFRAFAHPYFSKGKGWTFVPKGRNVSIEGDFAWFDEVLSSAHYSDCRGTGVLRRAKSGWEIVQYNLTIPIPNELADEVVGKIRAGRKGPGRPDKTP